MNYLDAYRMIKEAADYTVKAGDTLSQIAANNKVNTADLAKWNNIADPNKIGVGQKLTLSAPAAQQNIPVYNRIQIKPGQTLGGLSKTYNTSVDHLAKVNKITDPNKIRAGQYMLVPTGKMLGQQTAPAVTQTSAPAKFDVNTPLADDMADRVLKGLWTMESGQGKWLSNPKSSASGHFHWTNATWQDFAKAHPDETTNMTKANLDDYDTAAKFQKMKLQSDALRYQKATGKQVTDKDLYAIHYGGFGGRNNQAAINYANTAADPDLYKKRGYK
jgi:LysM repeat protein